MRHDNIKLIEKLLLLKVLETKDPTDSDVIITSTYGNKHRLSTEQLDDPDVPILISAMQLEELKCISNILKFFSVLTIIGIAALLIFLFSGGLF